MKKILPLLITVLIVPTLSFAQLKGTLEDRVQALENYVDTFQPTMTKFSEDFEKSVRVYSNGLEKSLKMYTENMERELNNRLMGVENNKAILNPRDGSFQEAMTKTGMFYVAVKDVVDIGNGLRLTLDIGNPNYADFKDFTLKLIWGQSPPDSTPEEFKKWKASLYGAEFSFKGKLEKGAWNEVQVDLVPAAKKDFGYLELEMQVASVEMPYRK